MKVKKASEMMKIVMGVKLKKAKLMSVLEKQVPMPRFLQVHYFEEESPSGWRLKVFYIYMFQN